MLSCFKFIEPQRGEVVMKKYEMGNSILLHALADVLRSPEKRYILT